MWRLNLAWLPLLAACASPDASYYVVDQVSGSRTDLVRAEVPEGLNIDGSAREGWIEHAAELDGARLSVVGLDAATIPASLVASTEVSHHTSLMFVHFRAPEVSATIATDFNAEWPDFDDFRRVASFAEALRLCNSQGQCAAFDGEPLRTGDIVIVRLP